MTNVWTSRVKLNLCDKKYNKNEGQIDAMQKKLKIKQKQ